MGTFESEEGSRSLDGLLFSSTFTGPDSLQAEASLVYPLSSSGEAGQSGASGESGQGLLLSGESSSREMNLHNYRNTTQAEEIEMAKLQEIETLKDNLGAAVSKAQALSNRMDTKIFFPEQILLNRLFARGNYDAIIAAYTTKLRMLESALEIGRQVDQPMASCGTSVAFSRTSVSPQPYGPSQTAPQLPAGPTTPTPGQTPRRQSKFRNSEQPRVAPMRFDHSPRPDGKIPADFEEFKAFLKDHVIKYTAEGTRWTVGGLNNVYAAAHPKHGKWKSWIGTKTDKGWSNGLRITVHQILAEAFPNMSQAELNSHVAEGPRAEAQRETTRASRSYTTAEVYSFVSERMRALATESGCSNSASISEEYVCRKILDDVKGRWPNAPNLKIPNYILTSAWKYTKEGSSIEDIVKNLKMLLNSLSVPRGNTTSAAPSGQPPTSPSFSVPCSAAQRLR